MNKVICLLGLIGSGKDTVARYIEAEYGYKKESFAATLKDACAPIFNWPRPLLEGDTEESRHWREQVDVWWADKLGIPHFSPRFALQHIGTDIMRNTFHNEIWLLSLEKRLMSANENIVISDCRFKNEIIAAKRLGAVFIEVSGGAPPGWYEIARQANSGDQLALEQMETTYKHIHRSEWDWVGTPADFVIDNSSKERNGETLMRLFHKIDNVLGELRQ